MSAAAERVVRAIVEEGPAPTFHRAEVDRLRRGMPVLWRALEDLAREQGVELSPRVTYVNPGPVGGRQRGSGFHKPPRRPR